MTKGIKALMDEFLEQLLDDTVSIISVNYISNSLGTVNPIRDSYCRANTPKGVPVMIDAHRLFSTCRSIAGSGWISYFSSHKMYGPTGSVFVREGKY